MNAILIFAAGATVGGICIWLISRGGARAAIERARSALQIENAALNERLAGKERVIAESQVRCNALDAEVRALQAARSQLEAEQSKLATQIAEERKAAAEKLALIEEAKTKLADAFAALSAQALRSNNQSFLDLAKATLETFQQKASGDLEQRQAAIANLMKPVQETLGKFDSKLQQLETARVGAYEGLAQHLKSMGETQDRLRTEATNLVKALGTPRVRGRWGEIQLRRVVELAGMLNYCDFLEQTSVTTENGRQRPDLLVRLPNEKNIVVDAKAPLAAYLEAMDDSDDLSRQGKLKDHARQIRDHLKALGQKSYWEQFKPAPEFVVLFLPGENFYSAALEHDPSLIEEGVDNRVILATPTTLIALLKAVAFGWRQENLSQNADEISRLGKQLYDRIRVMGEHFARVGKGLRDAVENYNNAIGSLERNVLVSARRFQELKAAAPDSEMKELTPIEAAPRQIQAAELEISDSKL